MPSLLTHFLLPHTSNNHRSKALHIDALSIYLLLFIVFKLGLGTIHKAFPDILGYATDIHVEQLLETTNQKRQSQGLTPLALNDKLSAAAAAKAVDMFSKNYWAHNSPDGKTPWDFIVSSGYGYTVAGENLAKNFANSVGVVDAWMASPTHRDNILKAGYQDVGVAIVNGVLGGEETTLVVQMFGASSARPVSVAPPVKAVEVPAQAIQTSEIPEVALLPTIPSTAAVEPAAPPQTVASAFAAVTKKPLINIPTISREVAYIFLGIIMGILMLDGWLVSRRKIVRIAGHNIAHFVFFATIITILSFAQRGSLL